MEEITVRLSGDVHVHLHLPSDVYLSRPYVYVSPNKAFRETIIKLYEEEMLSDMQDYYCLFRLDNEICAVGFLSISDFITRLRRFLPDEMKETRLPNENQLRGLNVGQMNFPHWKWDKFGEKSKPHLMAVCNAYIQIMASYGFIHPSLNRRDNLRDDH